ncbi:hypothetical protein Tco_0664297 [Tanacetum coccineum]
MMFGDDVGIKIEREEFALLESMHPNRPNRTEEDPLHLRPGHGKEGEALCFNRLGRKEPATSARSGSRQRSPQAKRTEVEPRRHHLPRTRMPSHVSYDEVEIRRITFNAFQSAANMIGMSEFDMVPHVQLNPHQECRVVDKLQRVDDSYEDLRTAFRENYLQQTKHIKDPVEIHHIKQRDGRI